ncbi:ComF family protein [Pelagerythrobacter rhizovicinus]|uniref:ComF family protein n=1 Tax=Pelagerythrobacter rhizovicinus TaxID=2268576 RepID=A0A4Q2KNW4_9SPHN|nr:ComF family protein [Pelagerythrobacter rhizovicinus]RXZ66167.1 ComF family protein [Pelagerythrobacter rhizovicinus]
MQARQHRRVSAVRTLRESVAPLVDLVFPPRCPVCGEAIAQQDGLCAPCWGDLVIPGEPACATCQRPLASDAAGRGAICAPCQAQPPRHDGIAAGALYNDTARKLVLAFKHGRRIALAPMLARLIAARLPAMEGEWLVMPVPLHRWRLWHRGFNQAALIAAEIARSTDAELLVDGLERRKRTPALGGLGRKARMRTLRGAIAVGPRRHARIRGAQVLLVDDVLTSGATSDACVAALKRAGAARVVVACFARVLEDGGGGIGRPETKGPHNETPEAEAPGAT